MLNQWNDKAVNKLEKDWNKNKNMWTQETFKLAANLGKKFIDLGCGYGRFCEYLSTCKINDNFQYLGIDNSSAMIEKAVKKFSIANFAWENIVDVDFKKYLKFEFDTALCNEVFQHLYEPEQIKVLKNIAQINAKYNIINIQTSDHARIEICKLKGQEFINKVQSKKNFESLIFKIFGNQVIVHTFDYHCFKDVFMTTFLIKRE